MPRVSLARYDPAMRTWLLCFLAMLISGCAAATSGRVAHHRAGMSDLAGGVEERKVPYSQELRYPADWPEISATRDAGR